MRRKILLGMVLVLMMSLILGPGAIGAFAENIDPNHDGSQYAYSENVGWVNAEPSGNGGPGMEVDGSNITGYIWGENIGWISLSCQNTASCGRVDYGVTNDEGGNLSGFAWGENVGWISFCGVVIDDEGNFDGWAWGENIGWMHFRNLSIPYKIQTAWVPSQPTVQGDLDGDGDVDYEDYLVFRTAYGSCSGDDNFIPSADLDKDCCVTINDYRIFRTLM